jgi:hypothetical protein
MKKIWNDPVWSTVIASVLLAGFPYILGIWPSILNLIGYALNILATPIIMPFWLLLVAVPVLLIAIPLLKKLSPDKAPRFTKYTNDNIFDINWSWRWGAPNFHSNNYQVRDLTSRCPDCHALLEVNYCNGKLVACINENCNWQWKRQQHHGSRFLNPGELHQKVHNEIDRRVHSGEKS